MKESSSDSPPSSHQDSNDAPDDIKPEPAINLTISKSGIDVENLAMETYFHTLSLKYFASYPPVGGCVREEHDQTQTSGKLQAPGCTSSMQ
ncbi:unnamed protein product [Eruca vesicaria subsp. sativa]|uniref:Uncharacterized protein n=1 Tax=Eruca vesicaria subsp. sativa TaxID=29727 RepID=A0ABC8M6C4_ERUVS|nr:unnamed protein product [Eruca vesicaria subsp. sativa]